MSQLRSRTVLLVDVVDSTALAGIFGHERMEQLMADELAAIQTSIESQGGMVVRFLGDGILAVFESALDGLEAGAEIHRVAARFNEERRLNEPLQVRVALAATDVTIANGDVRGAAPIHAARIEKLVPAGHTYCTEAVRLLALGRGAFEFDSLGPIEMKGLDEALVLHRVRAPVGDVLGMPESLDATRRFDFVGRATELSQLHAAWEHVLDGSGRVMVISGEPGIGKTRLCREFARSLRRKGAIVLHGRCPEHAGQAFAPFVQPLRTILARVNDGASLLGSGVRELTRLLPELRRLVPELPAPSDEDVVTDRYRLFEAVFDWLRVLSSRTPLLLVIDDLSWADEASVQLLGHIAEGIDRQRVLVVASFRPADANTASRNFMRSYRRAIDRVELHGLTDDQVVAFVEKTVEGKLEHSGRQLAIRLGEHVGGNPLYLGEAAGSLATDGLLLVNPDGTWRAADAVDALPIPPAVTDLIRARAESLSPLGQSVLRIAAIVGFQVSTELLLDLVDAQPLEIVDALDELAAADLVEPRSSAGHEFTHAVVHDAIYATMSVARRAAEHHRVGESIERRYAADLEPYVDRLAYHFERGLGDEDTTRAVAYLRRAGRAADARLAYDLATAFYRRARALVEATQPDRASAELCDLLIEQGTAERRSGSETARRSLMRATYMALELGDAERATRAVLGAGRGTFSIAGEVEAERVDALQRTLELTGPAPTAQRARLLATLSSELAFDDDPAHAEAVSDEAIAISASLRDPGLAVTVLGNRLIALGRADKVEERLRVASELEKLCQLAGDNRRGKFLSAMTVCCQVAMEAGDFVTADRILAWMDETASTLRQPTSVGYAKLRLASRACLAGRLDEAEVLAEEAYQYCAQAGQPDAEVFRTGQLFTIRIHQGRTAEIIEQMAYAAKHFPGIVAFAAGVAACAADSEDPERCERVLAPVLNDLDSLRFDLNWLTTLALAAVGVHHVGDEKAAMRIRTMIEPYRRYFIDNHSAFFGSAHHYYGLLSATIGDEAAVRDAFDAAIEAHTNLRSPPWLARTHLEYASALVSLGHADDDKARVLVTAALEEGNRGGLGTILRRGDQLLAALPA
jgi:class 3 adenylate cyclase